MTTRPGTLAAFTSRDFRPLWSGQTISFVCDAAFVGALVWRVTDLTGKVSSHRVRARRPVARDADDAPLGRRARRPLFATPAHDLFDLARGVLMTIVLALEVGGHKSLKVIILLAVPFGAADG